jgi:hypothetical protein
MKNSCHSFNCGTLITCNSIPLCLTVIRKGNYVILPPVASLYTETKCNILIYLYFFVRLCVSSFCLLLCCFFFSWPLLNSTSKSCILWLFTPFISGFCWNCMECEHQLYCSYKKIELDNCTKQFILVVYALLFYETYQYILSYLFVETPVSVLCKRHVHVFTTSCWHWLHRHATKWCLVLFCSFLLLTFCVAVFRWHCLPLLVPLSPFVLFVWLLPLS